MYQESPTKVLNEFTEMLSVQLKTRDSWEQHEVLNLMHSSQAYALNRYIERLEKAAKDESNDLGIGEV